MLYLAGIFITFFLFVLLASKKGKSGADRVLTAWLVVMGLHLTMFYFYISGNYLSFPWLLGWDIAMPLAHGPFLFLYTTALTRQRKIKSIGWLHFLPLAIIYVLMIRFFLLSNEKKILVYKNKGAGYEWLTSIVLVAIMASGIIYVVLSFLRLRKHKTNIESQFSNTTKISLDWLRYLIYGIAAIWVIIIAGLDDFYVFAAAVLFIFFIGYFGIRQVGIFTNPALSGQIPGPLALKDKQTGSGEENVLSDNVTGANGNNNTVATIREDEPVVKTKYQKSSLSEDTATKLYQQLQQLMVNEKLFTNPELNLGELAERLDIHPNVLSQVINSFEKKTFYDYINGLRIEQFKHLVSHPDSQQYTLLSLAFDCGFNSKTAFNRNFKKATGLSPSEYLSQVKVNLA